MNASKNKAILIIIMLAIFVLTWVAFVGVDLGDFQITGMLDSKASDKGIRLGLDLQGGVSITYVAEIPEGTSNEDKVAGMDSAVEILRRRLTANGLTEATLNKVGEHAIHVEIPGVENPDDIVAVLGTTAELTFRDADGNVLLQGNTVESATARYGSLGENKGSESYVELVFKEEFRSIFTDATKAAAALASEGKNYIAVYLDEEMVSNPFVDAKFASTGIEGDSCVVSFGGEGNQSSAAKEFAALVNSGRLPFKLTYDSDVNPEASMEIIGPQLGADALDTSLLAGLIGLILVALLMILYYRLPGLISVIALIGYVALVALIMTLFRVNLSLPGIAGCLLGIGMAVDANVIIFERMKEELRAGKTIKSAVNGGYKNALSSIIDSNITTLIAAVVLWWQGTGSIQGFAITLFISVMVSMFTALIVTRWLFNGLLGFNLKSLALFGVKERGASNA